MAYKDFGKDFDGLLQGTPNHSSTTLHIDGQTVELPDASFVRDAEMTRDGMDLVLDGPNGTIVIEGYFAAEPTPDLVSPDGSTLTPELVNSFAKSAAEFANTSSMTDESPVGAVQEVTGTAKVTHLDGSVETISIGTKIYQGDIIETESDGAVNIMFVDETSFAVSEDARLAIDDYVFDPATQSGETNFSVLKGVFVFTSGLIGRDDPDDVQIDTPVGSIGIRGTIIAGNVDTGEITVIEGAIVLRDFGGNEVTLASQFETAKFSATGGEIEHIGQLSADDVASRFTTVSNVSPSLFSSINDAAAEQTRSAPQDQGEVQSDDVQDTAPAVDSVVPADEGAVVAPPPGPAIVPPPVGSATFGIDTSGFVHPADGPGPHHGPGPGGLPHHGPGPATGPAPVVGAEGPAGLPGTAATAPDAPAGTAGTGGAGAGAGAFSVTVSPLAFSELASGAVVATLTSNNGVIANAANISLSGLFLNKFEIVATGDPTIFNLKLKAGQTLDADFFQRHGLSPDLTFSATSTTGATDSGAIAVSVTNVNEAPVHEPQGDTANFLKVVEGQMWHYNFDKEFVDQDFGDTLAYSLSSTTMALLNSWSVGGGSGFDILRNDIGVGIAGAGDDNKGWSFNETNGELTLYTNSAFNFADGGLQNLILEVKATDTGALSTAFHNYTLTALNNHSTPGFSTIIDGPTQNNKVLVDSGNANTMSIGLGTAVTGAKIFMLVGDDTVTLTQGSNNYINLGDGNNTINIAAASNTANTIVGGNNQDTFNILNAQNKFFGMDGDDDFILDLGAAPSLITDLQTPGNVNIHFDGGWSNFRAGTLLDALDVHSPGAVTGMTGGRGDSLVIEGAGNLDFGLIDNNYFKNIERIDIQNSQANVLTLRYSDVIDMTDQKKTLLIGLGSLDTFNFDAEGHNFTKVADNQALDDGRAGGGADAQTFDVWTDGTVTLLINDYGTGAPVNITP